MFVIGLFLHVPLRGECLCLRLAGEYAIEYVVGHIHYVCHCHRAVNVDICGGRVYLMRGAEHVLSYLDDVVYRHTAVTVHIAEDVWFLYHHCRACNRCQRYGCGLRLAYARDYQRRAAEGVICHSLNRAIVCGACWCGHLVAVGWDEAAEGLEAFRCAVDTEL